MKSALYGASAEHVEESCRGELRKGCDNLGFEDVSEVVGIGGMKDHLTHLGSMGAGQGAPDFNRSEAQLIRHHSEIYQQSVGTAVDVGISQGHNVFTNTLIYAALPEFYAILGLVGAIMAK